RGVERCPRGRRRHPDRAPADAAVRQGPQRHRLAGDDAASSFGVNVGPVRVGLIALAVTLAAVVVSFCGIIGFVGLVGPHIARLAIGADHRHLLPFAALSGGLLLLVADAVGRTVIASAVVPVGIVVAFIGGPVFIYLILTRRNTLK